MPRIWRMRLVNIQYDAGKKVFADELFNFGGKNTLFNLANGGGKTLLVQLMLQTVLPNERLNKRRLSDLLQNRNFTGHIPLNGVWIRLRLIFCLRVFVSPGGMMSREG